MRPVDHIGRVQCPVFIISGMADAHTTLADTNQLYAAAHAPKQPRLVPRAAHVDLLRAHPAEYTARVLAFFDAALHHDAHAQPAAADSNRHVD